MRRVAGDARSAKLSRELVRVQDDHQDAGLRQPQQHPRHQPPYVGGRQVIERRVKAAFLLLTLIIGTIVGLLLSGFRETTDAELSPASALGKAFTVKADDKGVAHIAIDPEASGQNEVEPTTASEDRQGGKSGRALLFPGGALPTFSGDDLHPGTDPQPPPDPQPRPVLVLSPAPPPRPNPQPSSNPPPAPEPSPTPEQPSPQEAAQHVFDVVSEGIAADEVTGGIVGEVQHKVDEAFREMEEHQDLAKALDKIAELQAKVTEAWEKKDEITTQARARAINGALDEFAAALKADA